MNNGFESLHHRDVVSIDPKNFDNLDVSNTFKVVQLLEVIKEYIGSHTQEAHLFDKGVDAEVLRLGAKDWQKGKVRITLEFCPDEPESPLEDIRQRLKEAENC